MDTTIITLDSKGKYRINDEDALVFNLYRTVYSLPTVDKQLYEERMNKAGLLLTMIRLEMGTVEDAAILNLAWGVYKIGKIEDEEFDRFFSKESSKLCYYEGHERVVEYVNTCLTTFNASIHFQITQEKMPSSAFKTVEKIDKLGENITNNEKAIRQMVKMVRESVKEMGERLDEAEKKLAEREKALKKAREENEQMQSDTFCKEVGEEYLRKKIKDYLRNAKRWSQHRRDSEYDWLKHLSSLGGIPQDVQDMIEALAVDKEEGKGGMMVNTHTYVETQNNNYK